MTASTTHLGGLLVVGLLLLSSLLLLDSERVEEPFKGNSRLRITIHTNEKTNRDKLWPTHGATATNDTHSSLRHAAEQPPRRVSQANRQVLTSFHTPPPLELTPFPFRIPLSPPISPEAGNLTCGSCLPCEFQVPSHRPHSRSRWGCTGPEGWSRRG